MSTALWSTLGTTVAPLLVRVALGGLVVAGLALAVGALVPRRAAAARIAVWRMGVVALLLLPVLSIAPPWQWTMPLPVEWLTPERARLLQGSPDAFVAERPARTASAHRPADASGGGPDGPAASTGGETIAQSGPFDRQPAASPATGDAGMIPLLGGLWALVAAAILLRLGLGLTALWLHARRARDVTDEVAHFVPAIPRRGGRRVRILRGGPFAVPGCWGLVRPVVLLPSGSEAWSEQRLRAVLLHETSHLERHDPLFLVLSRVACALHWLNPLAWLLQRRLSRDGEAASDEAVIRGGVPARDYARMLVELAAEARNGHPRFALGMAQPGTLSRRVSAILEWRASPPARKGLAVTASLLLGSAAVACAMVSVEAPPATEPAQAPVVESLKPAVAPAPAPPAPPGDATPGAPAPAPDLVIDALIGALADPYPPVRRSAVNSLRDLGDARGLDALRPLLSDPDPDVRRAAAVTLGLEEPRPNMVLPAAPPRAPVSEDSMAAVVRGLEARDALTRVRAANALGNLRDARAVPALARALTNLDDDVRQAAAGALGNIGDAGAVPDLVAAYPDPDDDVRQAIASALGAIGDRRAVPVLVRAVLDAERHVRRIAAEALGRMRDPGARTGMSAPAACEQPGSAPSALTLAEAVVVLLQDPDAERRTAAAVAIGRLARPGDRGHGGPLDGSVPTSAKDHQHALTAAASDPATSVRLAAICSLGRVGDERALEPLGWRTREREDPAVRRAAAWAAANIRARAGIASAPPAS